MGQTTVECDLVAIFSNPGRISRYAEALDVDMGRWEYVQGDDQLFVDIPSIDYDEIDDVKEQVYGVK